MSSKTLLQISDELRDLERRLLDAEADDEKDVLLEQYFSVEEGELAPKIDNYCELIRELEAIASTRKERAKEMADLAKADEALAKRLKARLQWYLEEEKGVKSLKTDRHNISIAKVGGKLPLGYVENLDPETLPEEFRKVTITPDNDAVRAALESGQNLPFASLGDRRTTIRIR